MAGCKAFVPGADNGLMARTAGEDAPWKDEETLRELYWDDGLSMPQIADELGCSGGTVQHWMDKFGIERRGQAEAIKKRCRVERARYTQHPDGHEAWRCQHGRETEWASVHALLLVSEGVDPHKVFSGGEYVVHHRNGIPWDNRPENLTLLTRDQHRIVERAKGMEWEEVAGALAEARRTAEVQHAI